MNIVLWIIWPLILCWHNSLSLFAKPSLPVTTRLPFSSPIVVSLLPLFHLLFACVSSSELHGIQYSCPQICHGYLNDTQPTTGLFNGAVRLQPRSSYIHVIACILLHTLLFVFILSSRITTLLVGASIQFCAVSYTHLDVYKRQMVDRETKKKLLANRCSDCRGQVAPTQ